MKLLMAAIVFLWSSALVGADLTLAASVDYEFVTADIPTDQPNRIAFPEDIDDDGTLLANTGGAFSIIVTQHPKNARKNISLDCGRDATSGTAINQGRITGFCANGAFVRLKDGTLIMLSALGENAIGFGMAKDGTVGGQYCTPNGPPNFGCTLHGFTWHSERGYKTIDYIDGRPGSHTLSVVIAPTSNGRVLGAYTVMDQNNNYLEDGYYLYDNGIFDTVSLPRSFGYIGGPATSITDMNDLGQVIIHRTNTAIPRLELFDDGIFFQIAGWPAAWRLVQVGGSNNEGQFTGIYQAEEGFDPYYNSPIYVYHGFVATPAPVRKAKAKGEILAHK